MDSKRDEIVARIAARRVLLNLANELRGRRERIGWHELEFRMAKMVEEAATVTRDEIALELDYIKCPECGITFAEDEAVETGSTGSASIWDCTERVKCCSKSCRDEHHDKIVKEDEYQDSAERSIDEDIRRVRRTGA